MPSFHNGAVEIAYLDEGEGDPILLVHGFASTMNVNWVYPTWVSELKKNGRRVIALDNRGHGDSEKLYDPEAYHIPTMAGDVSALMDHLDIERADCPEDAAALLDAIKGFDLIFCNAESRAFVDAALERPLAGLVAALVTTVVAERDRRLVLDRRLGGVAAVARERASGPRAGAACPIALAVTRHDTAS